MSGLALSGPDGTQGPATRACGPREQPVKKARTGIITQPRGGRYAAGLPQAVSRSRSSANRGALLSLADRVGLAIGHSMPMAGSFQAIATSSDLS